MQPDLPEEQHPNAENPQEAIEVAETDAQPHVKHLNFTTLIIVRLLSLLTAAARPHTLRRQDLAILVARKLSWKTK